VENQPKEFFDDEEVNAFLGDLETSKLAEEDFLPEDFIVDEELEDMVDEDPTVFAELATAIIKQVDKKWYVYTEDGKKKLGGPYNTKKEAINRLAEIEHFKSMAGDTYRNKLDPKSPHNSNHRRIKMKCRKCGSTKNIDLHHKNGKRDNLNSTKNIVPLCRSCHRALHQGKGSYTNLVVELEKILSDIKLVIGNTNKKRSPDLELMAIATEILDADTVQSPILNEFLSKAGLNKQKDLLYVAFKLVHTGTNRNKDTFLEDELKAATGTPVLKSLNWEHTNENIGVIYDSKFIDATEKEPSHLVVAAAVWKMKFPERAAEMVDRFTQNTLTFSMETWFEKAQCSECGKIHDKTDDVCDHLLNRFLSSSNVSRVLKDLTFGGAGVVKTPADIDAEALAIAKMFKNNTEGVSKDMDDKALQMLEDAQKEKKLAEEKINQIFSEKQTAEVELAQSKTTIEDLTKQLDFAKSELVSTKDALETLATAHNGLKKQLEDLSAVVAGIETQKKAEARCETLASIGFGPGKDNDKYQEHFERIKALDDKAFDALVEACKLSESAKGTIIPTGDADTDKNKKKLVKTDFPALAKLLENL
jgi:hypothetical protein